MPRETPAPYVLRGDIALSVSVSHHPSRSERLAPLLEALGHSHGGRPRVVVDDRGEPPSLVGLRYTFLQSAVPLPGATHHLVLQDDAVLCRDFVMTLGRALAARPQHAVAPYSNRQACHRAREKQLPWAELFGEIWGIAVALPALWWWEFLAFQRDAFLPEARFSSDGQLRVWLAFRGRSTWATVPSLLDHAAGPSLIGHNAKPSRAAWALTPDLSGLGIDWQRTAGAPHGGVTLRSALEANAKALAPDFWAGHGWHVEDGSVRQEG